MDTLFLTILGIIENAQVLFGPVKGLAFTLRALAKIRAFTPGKDQIFKALLFHFMSTVAHLIFIDDVLNEPGSIRTVMHAIAIPLALQHAEDDPADVCCHTLAWPGSTLHVRGIFVTSSREPV
jgi:hypothetical protein